MRLGASPYIIMALALLLLISPLVIKSSFDLAGKEPYLIDRLSSQFLAQGIEQTDSLSFSGRPYIYPFGTVVIASLIKKLTSHNTALIYLPIILGVLSSLLFYSLIRLLSNTRTALISSLIFIISPSFIYTFAYLKEFTLPFFLILLASYLLLTKKLTPIAYALLAITPFFGIEHAIISLLILFVFFNKEQKPATLISYLLIIILLLVTYFPLLMSNGFPAIADFEEHNPAFKIFSDFGSRFGISLFIIFLAVFGLKELWKEKYTHIKVYISLLIILVLLVIKPSFIIYATLLLAPLAALGIHYLLNIHWESKIIKELTIFILILGLIFSAASYLNSYKTSQPSKAIISSLAFLGQNTPEDSVILSHYTYGIWINSLALRKNVMDEQFLYAPKLNKRYKDVREIFSSRNLERTKALLSMYAVTHIYITPEMKQGLTWDAEEEGLLFVLKFSKEDFTQIYNKNGIEIWQVKR